MHTTNTQIRNFWIAFMTIIAILASALCVYYAFLANVFNNTAPTPKMDDSYYQGQLKNHYRQAAYELTDNLKNIEANLGKITASNDGAMQQKYLSKVISNAECAVYDLAALPLQSSTTVEKTIKFTNQLADYSKSLSYSLDNSGMITDTDRANLVSLGKVAAMLKEKMTILSQSDDVFVTNTDEKKGQVGGIFANIEDIEENSIDYEKLIYDGPYSDAVTNKKMKLGKTQNVESGEEYLRTVFADYNVQSVQFQQEYEGKTRVRSYEVITDNGSYSVMMTLDNRIAQLNCYNDPTDVTSEQIDFNDCKEKAEKFARKLGYNVTATWASMPTTERVYVNLVYCDGGVIAYPDMVKVAIDSSNGKAVGFESFAYLANHKEISLPENAKSMALAQGMLNPKLEVVGSNIAIIPVGSNQFACYEFQCKSDKETYYVYIDMVSLKEHDILKVVETDQGMVVI